MWIRASATVFDVMWSVWLCPLQIRARSVLQQGQLSSFAHSHLHRFYTFGQERHRLRFNTLAPHCEETAALANTPVVPAPSPEALSTCNLSQGGRRRLSSKGCLRLTVHLLHRDNTCGHSKAHPHNGPWEDQGCTAPHKAWVGLWVLLWAKGATIHHPICDLVHPT